MSLHKLEKVNPNSQEHIELLYKLLINKKDNISHERIPELKDHISFVRSNPYRFWYLINTNNKIIGSIYLANDNSIGINLFEPRVETYKDIIQIIKKKHMPLPLIKSIRNKEFIISVSINNRILKQALKEMKISRISSTYLIN